MGVAEFELVVEGTPGEISLDAFATVLKQANDVLDQVGRTVAGSRKRVVRGFVTDLSLSSLAARLEVRSEPEAVDADPYRTVRSVIGGLRMVEDRDELPPDFPDRALKGARRMADAVKGGATGVTLRLVDDPAPDEVLVTRRLISNVDRAMATDSTVLGGIYGTVDLLNARGKNPWFGVRDELSHRPVHCARVDADVDEIKELFGHRVYAHGELRRNARGQTTALQVQTMERLPEQVSELSIAHLFGAFSGATGGLTAEEFVRDIRDDVRDLHDL